jgi:hypothetical protein
MFGMILSENRFPLFGTMPKANAACTLEVYDAMHDLCSGHHVLMADRKRDRSNIVDGLI